MIISDKKYNSPDVYECMKALEDYGTPDHVIDHCKAVSAVGYKIAEALCDVNFDLDLDLIRAAGLLHDMARVEERHWDAAADRCLCMGWDKEAEIIRVHMSYEFNDFCDFNETDIVCLADRLVMEDKYVGLKRRIDYVIAKAIKNGKEEQVPIIERKKEETMKLIEEIEEYLGISLDDLMAGLDYERPDGR